MTAIFTHGSLPVATDQRYALWDPASQGAAVVMEADHGIASGSGSPRGSALGLALMTIDSRSISS